VKNPLQHFLRIDNPFADVKKYVTNSPFEGCFFYCYPFELYTGTTILRRHRKELPLYYRCMLAEVDGKTDTLYSSLFSHQSDVQVEVV
jgi:hypothetical protein